jgi:hypothetical protein
MVAALTSVIGRRGDAASAALVERIFLAAREGGEALGGAAWSCAIGAMCRFYTLVPIRPRSSLVPIRPRSRGERRSLRTLPVFSLRPALAFNPRPQRLSTPTDAYVQGEHARDRVADAARDDERAVDEGVAVVSDAAVGEEGAFSSRWFPYDRVGVVNAIP